MNAEPTTHDGAQSRNVAPSEWGKPGLRHVHNDDGTVTLFDPTGSDEATITVDAEDTLWPRCET